ncbi:MAG: hypothetical protein ABIG44_09285 [Planctomycetota bacterium]
MMDLAPGNNITVEITATPSNAAACKTLARICCKDPQVATVKRWHQRRRPSWQTWRRGGRQWHHQMKSRPPVKLEPGAKYTIFATVDVIRDLQSVQRWVKTSPV